MACFRKPSTLVLLSLLPVCPEQASPTTTRGLGRLLSSGICAGAGAGALAQAQRRQPGTLSAWCPASCCSPGGTPGRGAERQSGAAVPFCWDLPTGSLASTPRCPQLYRSLLMCPISETPLNKVRKTDSVRTVTSSPGCPRHTVPAAQEASITASLPEGHHARGLPSHPAQASSRSAAFTSQA